MFGGGGDFGLSAGISGLLGGLTGAAGDVTSAMWARAESSRARRFAREVMQSRYQWQMEDMRKAGLNPILAFGQSPPAPTPQGRAATADFGKVISSARSAALMGQELENMEKTAEVLDSQERKNWFEADAARYRAVLDDMLSRKADADRLVSLASAKQIDAATLESMSRTQLNRLAIPSAAADAALWENLGATGKAVGMFGRLFPPARLFGGGKGGAVNRTIHEHYRQPGRAPSP